MTQLSLLPNGEIKSAILRQPGRFTAHDVAGLKIDVYDITDQILELQREGLLIEHRQYLGAESPLEKGYRGYLVEWECKRRLQ